MYSIQFVPLTLDFDITVFVLSIFVLNISSFPEMICCDNDDSAPPSTVDMLSFAVYFEFEMN